MDPMLVLLCVDPCKTCTYSTFAVTYVTNFKSNARPNEDYLNF